MTRRLSTWLVVALTGGAFALGLSGGAFLAGGGHGDKSTAPAPPPVASNPETTPTTVTHAAPSSEPKPTRLPLPPRPRKKPPVAPAVSAPTGGTPVTAVTPRTNPVTVATPEPNPVAGASPTPVPVAGPAPSAPAVAPAQPASPPKGKEVSKAEASARHAIASGGVSLLQEAAAEGGAGNGALKVVQELEKCLELVASSLPGGLEPPPCEVK